MTKTVRDRRSGPGPSASPQEPAIFIPWPSRSHTCLMLGFPVPGEGPAAHEAHCSNSAIKANTAINILAVGRTDPVQPFLLTAS